MQSSCVAPGKLRNEKRVEANVGFEECDLFTIDLREADVVTLYLPGSLLGRLVPQLKALRPVTRIVSHEFVIPGSNRNELFI